MASRGNGYFQRYIQFKKVSLQFVVCGRVIFSHVCTVHGVSIPIASWDRTPFCPVSLRHGQCPIKATPSIASWVRAQSHPSPYYYWQRTVGLQLKIFLVIILFNLICFVLKPHRILTRKLMFWMTILHC